LLSTCTKTPRSFRLGLQRYEHFLYFQTFLQKFSKKHHSKHLLFSIDVI